MAHVLLAILGFALVVMTHMLWCRGRRKSGIAVRSLVLIAALYLPLLVLADAVFGAGDGMFWTSVLLYLSLVPFYFSFYHSIVINSPTRMLLERCLTSGPQTYQELLRAVKKEDYLLSRLAALLKSGLAVKKGDRHILSRRGRRVAGFLRGYQKMIGRPMGE